MYITTFYTLFSSSGNISNWFVSSGIPVEVPLWLGLNLRQRGKCRLVMPDWLDEEKLAEKKEEETQSKVFTVHIGPKMM